jgi:hypothetical protein
MVTVCATTDTPNGKAIVAPFGSVVVPGMAPWLANVASTVIPLGWLVTKIATVWVGGGDALRPGV